MRAGRLDLAGVAAPRAALTDAAEVARYESNIVTVPDSECWWWAAAVVEMSEGLAEREALMEARALVLAEDAAGQSAPWLRRLGQPPARPKARDRWIHEARTVAAYRDRYGIDERTTLGPVSTTDVQRLDRARAAAAIRRAEAVSRESEGAGGHRRRVGVAGFSIGE